MGNINKIMLFSMVFAGFVPSSAVLAYQDDFGARFYDQAPKALGDFVAEETQAPEIAMDMDNVAEDLQNIMPAAGEEEFVSERKKKDDTAP